MVRRATAFTAVRTGLTARSKRSFLRSGCIVVLALLVGVLATSHGSALDTTVGAAVREYPAPQLETPIHLRVINDPLFGTTFARVTMPGMELVPGATCNLRYCRQRYSSAQAWNADQSLLVITAGCPGFCFLDGQDYKPLFWRSGFRAECEWHPTDPAIMICVTDRAIYSWNVQNNTKELIFLTQSHASLQFGPSKGNLSFDGSKLAVRAVDSSGEQVVFVYDVVQRRKYPDIRLAKLQGVNSYCTVSPSGQYVFCYQSYSEKISTAYVLTLQGELVQHWPEHHRPGHGDLTVDQDGQDIYVGISKSEPDKFHVIKRRLVDGAVTKLLTRSSAQHVSARSIKRPGWVFVTFGTASPKGRRADGWAPYIQEIAALKLDGSGDLRRIISTQSAKHDYWSEAHASPSPDGSKVIWASNWGRAGDPVSSYVANVRWGTD